MAASPRKAKALKDCPIHLIKRPMADLSTGEIVACWVPYSPIDQRLMNERKYRTNDVVRATFAHPRSIEFHRLVHQLGTIVRENIEGFEHLDSHAVIKRLQSESGVECDVQKVSVGPFTVTVNVPRSIAFDCMDESAFRRLMAGLCEYIVARYWPLMTAEQVSDMAELMPQSEGA